MRASFLWNPAGPALTIGWPHNRRDERSRGDHRARVMMLSWLARTHRLVTATAGLLVVTIGGFTWIAYIRIRGLALSTAAEHLTVAASQLAAALTAGLPARINEIHAAAAHPEIVSYLTRQTNLTRAPAAQVLTGDVSRDSHSPRRPSTSPLPPRSSPRLSPPGSPHASTVRCS